MAQRKREKDKPEMGSERPFADLSDDEYKALQDKARFRMNARKQDKAARDYVSGDGALPSVDPDSQKTLIEARGMRDANDRTAQGTREIRDRVNQVRSAEPGAKPDYSGVIPAHLKPGYQAPVKPVDSATVNRAQTIMNAQEGYANSVDPQTGKERGTAGVAQFLKDKRADPNRGTDVTTVAVTDAQRADPAYQARVESARLAAEAHQRRQAQLNAIKEDVQNQRYREALQNRGQGIHNRAVASRERKDARIEYGREQGRLDTMTPQGRAAYLIDKNRNRRAEADREFASQENQRDRQSAERISETRASAPAGNRGYTQEQDRRAWQSSAKSFDPIIKNLKEKIDALEEPAGANEEELKDFNKNLDGMKDFYQKVLRGQQAIQMGVPFFAGGNIDQWAQQHGVLPGDTIVGLDENGYPLRGEYQPE